MRTAKEKKFEPKSGQTDYSKRKYAPVVNVVVWHRGKILLVKRNRKMRFYPGYWNGVSGFLDDGKSVRAKAKEELSEELGVKPKDIASMRFGKMLRQPEPRYHKVWVVSPVLVRLRHSRVKLDWEAERCAWVSPSSAYRYKLLPGFKKVLAVFEAEL